MTDIFGDEEDDGETIIPILMKKEVAKKPPANTQPSQQESSPKSSVPIFICPAQVSQLNASTGQYQSRGTFPICFLKQDIRFTILVLGPNKQPIIGIPITEQISWQIQNELYCTTVDSNNIRWLFYFQTPIAAQIASVISLSLSSKRRPATAASGDGPKVVKKCVIDHFQVNISQSINTNQQVQTDVEINCEDDTVIGSKIKNHLLNEKLVISLGNDTYEFVSIKKIIEEQANETRQVQPLLQTPQVSSQAEKENQPQTQTMPQVLNQPKHTVDEIYSTLSSRFDKLEAMMSSLKPRHAETATISNERILSEIQIAVTEASQKDAHLRSLDSTLSRLTSIILDDEEMLEIQQQISELEESIAAERAKTLDVDTDHTLLKETVSKLQKEVDQANEKLKAEEDKLRQKVLDEIESSTSTKESLNQDAQKRIEAAIAEQKQLTLDLETLRAENKTLSQNTNNEGAAEVAEMKEKISAMLTEKIQSMGLAVLKTIQESLDPSGRYKGAAVTGACQTVLQRVATRILNPGADDYDYDDEEEEEEDA